MQERVAAAVIVAIGMLTAASGFANADAGDDYPIPDRILKAPCTVDQYMAAVRDTEPVYYQRYMIDYNNRPPDIQQGARDRIYWFFSLHYAGRRQYSEDTATNVYYEQMATHWGNWAKLFSTTKASPPTAPTSAPSTRATTCRCGTGTERFRTTE
jgi:hypothetical protein